MQTEINYLRTKCEEQATYFFNISTSRYPGNLFTAHGGVCDTEDLGGARVGERWPQLMELCVRDRKGTTVRPVKSLPIFLFFLRFLLEIHLLF